MAIMAGEASWRSISPVWAIDAGPDSAPGLALGCLPQQQWEASWISWINIRARFSPCCGSCDTGGGPKTSG